MLCLAKIFLRVLRVLQYKIAETVFHNHHPQISVVFYNVMFLTKNLLHSEQVAYPYSFQKFKLGSIIVNVLQDNHTTSRDRPTSITVVGANAT